MRAIRQAAAGLTLLVLASPLAAQVPPADYGIRWNGGSWEASNRTHGFRAVFGENGAAVMPRRGADEWRWEMRAGMPPVGAPVIGGSHATYRHQGFTESYANDETGLRYALEIERPEVLAGSPSTIRAALAFHGDLRAVQSSGAIDFLDGKETVLRLRDVRAVDAAGRELSSRVVLAPAPDRAIVEVEGEGAVYPVTIHALAASPNWTYATAAESVASAGDVNGDGFGDVIVGNTTYANGETDEGAAFLFLGSPSGLATTPAWTAEGNQADARFGNAVSGAGDVNGDGYADVIVGAWHYDNGELFEGRAYLYHGSATGLASTPAWTVESNSIGAELGYSVAGAGDVNGDGYADVIVGCYRCEDVTEEDGEGWALIYHGSASGVSATPAVILQPDVVDTRFGGSVAGAGDVNGDGYADVIVGAHRHHNPTNNEGGAFVYLGSASGVASTPVWSAESDQMGAQFGISVSGAGDVNGDGYSDVVIGAVYYTNAMGEGRTYLYYGSPSGPAGTPWIAESSVSGTSYGWSVAGAGDVNGDGYADIIAGANSFGSHGRVYVYHGSASGPPLTASWIEDGDENDILGYAVNAAGDVNGDGFADVIMAGATKAVVHHGAGGTHAEEASWNTTAALGSEVGAAVADAGDVNGDGFSDVIVGSPATDSAFVYLGSPSGFAASPSWSASQPGTYFGGAVAGAGDVNGDGYADVIVGASGFANGEESEGAAFLYHGGPSGLSATAAWMVEGGQANAALGVSVDGAGDVDGDGFGDVVVGANRYEDGEPGEGRALVYHGSASGLSMTASWTAQGNQANAELGTAVAGAGDVNGDGYADVVVGAYLFDDVEDNEGRAFVYHGSPSGLGAASAWTAESDQPNSWFGYSVAGAGDVNGDGFADVVVGAFRYDDPEANEGRAFVYHGSPSGLSAGPVSEMGEDIEHAWLGYSVAGVGDVDGDGFADVMVGAPVTSPPFGQANEGRAYLYRGSASGVAAPASWFVEGNVDGVWLGESVGAAGDVNGDGFADSIVGVPYAAAGGQASLFLGNETAGRAALPRQLRAEDSIFAEPWGLSDDNEEFRVRMTAKSPEGRTRVKLEVEACPQGAAFGSMACVTVLSPGWTDVTASANGVTLTSAIGGLSSATLYRWRARTLYAAMTVTAMGITPPPQPRHGPWRRLHAQAREADIRVLAAEPPAAPAGLVAAAVSTGEVAATWTAVPGAAAYQIDRRDPGGTFVQIGTSLTNAYSDDSVSASTAYLYRVRAVNAFGVSPHSASDLATTVLFTNDPLTAGIAVKAVHLSQLRTAVNAVRMLAGEGAASFTGTATAGVVVKAVHITELRTLIDGARDALGLTNAAYTDSLLAGVKVKAVHFQQLRERMR